MHVSIEVCPYFRNEVWETLQWGFASRSFLVEEEAQLNSVCVCILQFEPSFFIRQSSQICMIIIFQAFEYIPKLPFRLSCLILKNIYWEIRFDFATACFSDWTQHKHFMKYIYFSIEIPPSNLISARFQY